MMSGELKDILVKHAAWLMENRSGSRADLHEADLHEANLRGVDLSWANLSWADLRGANLRGANLCGANLSGADFRGANLCGADFRGANLSEANLRETDLMLLHIDSYDIAIQSKYTSIGCKRLESDEWLMLTPEDVSSFAKNAKEFHETYGDLIKQAIRLMQRRTQKK